MPGGNMYGFSTVVMPYVFEGPYKGSGNSEELKVMLRISP